MKTLIFSLLSLVTLAWGWDVFTSVAPAGANTLWVARQEALHLSGLLSVAMMSLVMFLATRPAWLETPLGGMDRIYRAHKWAGITAVGFAAAHWLIEMSDDILKAVVGREGRVDKEKFTGGEQHFSPVLGVKFKFSFIDSRLLGSRTDRPRMFGIGLQKIPIAIRFS